MKFKPGKLIEKSYVKKDGKRIEVVFRYPKTSDVDGLLKYINSLIEGGARLVFVKKIKKKDEIIYLKEQIKKLKQGKTIDIIIEINKKIIGKGDIWVGIGTGSHIAEIGLGLMKDFRGLGIAKRLMQTLMKMAKQKWKIKLVKLRVCKDNKRARKLYKSLGFKYTGKIPKGLKYKGKYYDELIMYKRV